MKKISITAVLLAFAILISSASLGAFALEEIDFVPQLKAGKLYGVSLGSTEAHVRTAYYSKTIEIRDAKGNVLNEGNQTKIGTGFSVKIDGISYAVVVMGDINGDALMNVADYLMLKRAIVADGTLTALGVEAAGASSQDQLKGMHYLKLKRAVLGNYDINSKYSCDPYVPEIGEESSNTEVSDNNPNDWI